MRRKWRPERSPGPLPLQQSAADGALTQGRGYRGHIVAYLSATMPALIAGDVDPLTLTPAVYAESRRVSA